jgi:cytosine/adenosine deaminase-related metal-dependent hydrolase
MVMNKKTITIIKNINLIDVTNEKKPIINCTNIVVENEKIIDINDKLDAKIIKQASLVIDGSKKYAMPSFINCHAHIGMSVYKNTIGNMTTRE